MAGVISLLLALATALPGPKDISKPPPVPCFSITNYWPFERDAAGQWVHRAWAGQADSDPHHTAYMHPVTPDQAGQFVAGPDHLGGATIYLPGWGELRVLDRFGAEAYRAGEFYHYGYKRTVIPFDILTPRPTHYLECDGVIR